MTLSNQSLSTAAFKHTTMQFIVAVMLMPALALALNATAPPKTKRTVAGQMQGYGESRPVLLYPDAAGSAAGLNGFYAPVTLKPVFEPKQVAAQQVLYEFQQTPTNAVSNVHVNQFYQPIPPNSKPDSTNQYMVSSLTPEDTSSNNQFLSGSETVAAPVQHSSFVRHGQNVAQVQFQPLQVPHHIQTQQYVPGKYLYVNGKIVYQPGQGTPINGAYQNQQARPLNYLNPQQLSQRLSPPPAVAPMNYRRFLPPQRHQFQPITKPMVPQVTEEQNESSEEESAPVKEHEEVEENDASDEKASYEEADDDDEDDKRYFGKYSSFHDDDDEDEDHAGYRQEDEEDDDDDNERGSSKQVAKKKKSKPQKYSKSNNYKFSENFSTSSKFEKPDKEEKKGKKAPKMHYKAVKFTRQSNGKPRFEKIEGKQSQNVPVIHKQKIFKEKWYMTKSTDDSSS